MSITKGSGKNGSNLFIPFIETCRKLRVLSELLSLTFCDCSGNDSGLKHSVSSPDVEIHGSGYGTDDEDGDAVHGSGVSVVDVVEASGSPSLVQLRPQVTTTTTTTHIPPVHSYPEFERSRVSELRFFVLLYNGHFLNAVVGGTVVGLLTAILLVMFIVYRMRKKDEGSYALEEPKPRPYAGYAYTKASTKEFYA
ncbi:unnamed protein product [Angiostrongylus costaricensis]|uniref:Syndecan n=1 Tax=Angiostrongylus costaricensis TaxID=334426 RepID=A0A3P7I1Z0_ANGCS|nr:unnamed protein product [Angiostrongylus costaricensis]